MNMEAIELSYLDRCTCNSDRFCSFVETHEGFSKEEVGHLQSTIVNKKLSGVLYVSTMLATWSMIAAWVDAVILPLIILYTIAMPGAQYYPLLFPIVFTIVNAAFKFLFIYRRLHGAITLRDNFMAVVPYIGAAFLMKNWFVGDPLLRKASLAYMAHQKRQIVLQIKAFLTGK